jgi:NDP-sugar pyrophosphorylase family protein
LKGAILAAGLGSRLKGAGVRVPKPLVQVLGKTLVQRVVDGMRACGISEICCITNEAFAPRFGRDLGVHLVVKNTSGSMESLFALAPSLQGEPFVLSTVDAIFRPEQLAELLRAAQGEGTLAITEDLGGDSPLRVRLSAGGRLTAIGPAARGSRDVTAGFYVFSPRIFGEVGLARRRGLERLRDFLGLLLERGYALFGCRVGRTIDVDTPAEIAAAEEFLRS